jgi:hypothetical protein
MTCLLLFIHKIHKSVPVVTGKIVSAVSVTKTNIALVKIFQGNLYIILKIYKETLRCINRSVCFVIYS